MLAVALFNEGPKRFFEFEVGRLHASCLGFRFPQGTDFHDAAERVWMAMNHDNRPNGKVERSLSVGDAVLFLDEPTGCPLTLAECETCGFHVAQEEEKVTAAWADKVMTCAKVVAENAATRQILTGKK